MKALLLSSALLGAAAMLAAQPALSAERAGVAAGVRGDIQLVSLGAGRAVGRQVKSGQDIYLGDRITTGPRAGMQIMLLDQTTFTIGPDSEITIDTFVYDAEAGAGKIAATVSKGVFRFMTGRIGQNDPRSMSVRTPVAHVGIRGTIAGGYVDRTADGTPRAIFFLVGEGEENDAGYKAGAIVVENGGKSVRVARPGWGTVVVGLNGLPADPAPLPAELLTRLLGALKPAGGGQFPAGAQPASITSGADIARGQWNAGVNGSANVLRVFIDHHLLGLDHPVIDTPATGGGNSLGN